MHDTVYIMLHICIIRICYQWRVEFPSLVTAGHSRFIISEARAKYARFNSKEMIGMISPMCKYPLYCESLSVNVQVIHMVLSLLRFLAQQLILTR